jgi:ferrous iron transport protein A
MIDNSSHLQSIRPLPMPSAGLSSTAAATRPLSSLADGARATVTRVVAASADIDAVALRRLGELGFLPGEPVQLLRRGPGGREPLAVLIGETMFALRLLEAQCIEVNDVTEATTAGRRAAPGPAAPHGPRSGSFRAMGAATEGSVAAP